MKNSVTGAFSALSSFNYRVWASGALVSNIGTWMQLTNHDASAVGIVMGLQFAPQLRSGRRNWLPSQHPAKR
jgi:hypothetical protein